jgi:hypothetical protein
MHYIGKLGMVKQYFRKGGNSTVCVGSWDMKTNLTVLPTQVMLVLLLMFSGNSLLFGSPHLSHSKC